MIFYFILMAIFIGALMPVQAGINAQLTQILHHPFLGALVSFIVGTILIFMVILFHGGLFELKRISHAPPHLFIGGVFGALFVGSSIYLIPKLGATALIISFVTGQLIGSIIIDHYGLLGLPVRTINWNRLLGVLFLFLGLFLIVRKSS